MKNCVDPQKMHCQRCAAKFGVMLCPQHALLLLSWRDHILVVLQRLPIHFVARQRFEALDEVFPFIIVDEILESISLIDLVQVLLYVFVS